MAKINNIIQDNLDPVIEVFDELAVCLKQTAPGGGLNFSYFGGRVLIMWTSLMVTTSLRPCQLTSYARVCSGVVIVSI